MQISTKELVKAIGVCTTLEALGTLREALDNYLTPEQHALIFERMTKILISCDSDNADDDMGEGDVNAGDDITLGSRNNGESIVLYFM